MPRVFGPEYGPSSVTFFRPYPGPEALDTIQEVFCSQMTSNPLPITAESPLSTVT